MVDGSGLRTNKNALSHSPFLPPAEHDEELTAANTREDRLKLIVSRLEYIQISSDIHHEHTDYVDMPDYDLIEEISNYVSNIKSLLPDRLKHISNYLTIPREDHFSSESIVEKKIVNCASPDAVFALQIAKTQPEAAIGIILKYPGMFNPGFKQQQNEAFYFCVAAGQAAIYAHDAEVRVKQPGILEEKVEEISAFTARVRDEIDSAIVSANESAAAAEVAVESAQTAESVLSAAVATMRPKALWDDRIKHYSRMRNFSLAGFLVLAGGATAALIYYGPDLINRFTTGTGGLNLPAGLVTLFIVGSAFFALRLVGRMYTTAMARCEDARERSAMVETFLGLGSEEGAKLTEEERLIMLTALFRPGPGEPTDDSGTQHLLELLTKQVRSRPTSTS